MSDQLTASLAREIVAQLAPMIVAEVKRAIDSTINDRLLNRRQVAAKLGRSVSSINNLMLTRGFPPPVRVGGGHPEACSAMGCKERSKTPNVAGNRLARQGQSG